MAFQRVHKADTLGPVDPIPVLPLAAQPMTPKVSICVPNLNWRRFLPERFRSIFAQSYQNWELLVYDSFSDDGSWEYISELAAREPRMRAWQGPREGTPQSWNPCIREARGDYVYIATSDDTMAPDCLDTLVTALDAHPECDLAHCSLRAIDETGRVCRKQDWWLHHSLFARSSGPLLHRTHVRRAPFDGLLHMLGGSVYISITQLLIRRSLFDRVGPFKGDWGSVSDFNWCMRAGLTASTVHVPSTWGGWRVHPGQATAGLVLRSREYGRRIDEMIEDAVEAGEAFVSPAVSEGLRERWLHQAREMRAYSQELFRRRRWLSRTGFTVAQLCAGSALTRELLRLRLLGRPSTDIVCRWLAEIDREPALLPVVDTGTRAERAVGAAADRERYETDTRPATKIQADSLRVQ
jgi:glycosyltransferase involved in cell wall biosynthesis